jgi:hypothetical protein
MAKSFKEFGKKAEQLIEQGRVVDQKIQSCQARVASSNGRVATARKQLVAASETDEAGNPVGDVEHAKAELSMAENQLAASQRALSSARGDANRVRQQKNDHVQEIEKHNQVERSNLEKLRRLRLGAFGADSVALTDGMAQRLNEAEDARVALLRSMGIDATPDYVAIGDEGSADSRWRGGGFATLDTSGQVQSYQGGGSEAIAFDGGIATPTGGGLGTIGITVPEGVSQAEFEEGQALGIDQSAIARNTVGQQEEAIYFTLYGEEASKAIDIDRFVDGQMAEENTDWISQWNGYPRTPNEVLSDMKKSIRENWMNNFNADEWKRILPEKLYMEKIDMYRKGVAVVIGEETAAKLFVEDLEQLSRVQNHAYLFGCQLNEEEIADLYRNAVSHGGNFVTRRIEYKMDRSFQERVYGLLHTERYNQGTWRNLSVVERKDVLRNLLIDMNSIFGTDVSTDIDFFYEQSGSRGEYASSSNNVKINEFILAKDSSYQLMQTIIHEMRHAYQHHSVRNEKRVLVSSQTIKAWENNFNNYKSPSYGCTFEEYLSQPVEWDAKNFAKQYHDLMVMGIHPEYEGSWN